MKEHFSDLLMAAVAKKGTPVCVGLDPRLSLIPDVIKDRVCARLGEGREAAAHCFVEFCKEIVDAVADLVPCVKPQSAFFEQYGHFGVWAFEEVCKYADSKGLIVIGDLKRNDIGSTAEAYAKAYLGEVEVFDEFLPSFYMHAITVSPYLGYDGIKPFTDVARAHGKGVFMLLKTSNVSSGDLQDQLLDAAVGKGFGSDGRMKNYELMAHLLESWGSDDVGECGFSSLGAVVGATYPAQAKELRKHLPETIFLVPGYGAQGATAEDVRPCFREDGRGAIVNSSRDIIFAYQREAYRDRFAPQDFAMAARAATEAMVVDFASFAG